MVLLIMFAGSQLFCVHIMVSRKLTLQVVDHAFQLMLAHAGELGANAVIGVRYDATEIGPGITEVLCYGTAVSVQ